MLSKNVRRKLYEYVVDDLGLQIIKGDFGEGDGNHIGRDQG